MGELASKAAFLVNSSYFLIYCLVVFSSIFSAIKPIIKTWSWFMYLFVAGSICQDRRGCDHLRSLLAWTSTLWHQGRADQLCSSLLHRPLTFTSCKYRHIFQGSKVNFFIMASIICRLKTSFWSSNSKL